MLFFLYFRRNRALYFSNEPCRHDSAWEHSKEVARGTPCTSTCFLLGPMSVTEGSFFYGCVGFWVVKKGAGNKMKQGRSWQKLSRCPQSLLSLPLQVSQPPLNKALSNLAWTQRWHCFGKEIRLEDFPMSILTKMILWFGMVLSPCCPQGIEKYCLWHPYRIRLDCPQRSPSAEVSNTSYMSRNVYQ